MRCMARFSAIDSVCLSRHTRSSSNIALVTKYYCEIIYFVGKFLWFNDDGHVHGHKLNTQPLNSINISLESVSWIVLSTKYVKFNVQQTKIISQYNTGKTLELQY